MSQQAVQIQEGALRVVGRPVARVDGIEKVTGSAVFAYDMELPRMLYAKIHRSRFPHAEILSINKEKALKVPGVRAILTGEDVPSGLRGRGLLDTPILARGKVRYVGEPIAVVAAESLEEAEEAADLIEVEYKELSAMFDAEESLEQNPKVVIHPDIAKYKRLKAQMYKSASDPSRPNVTNYYRVRHGDVNQAFKSADFVFENRFTTHMVQHAHIEPIAVLARYESDGSYTIWTSGQNTYRTRKELSDALNIPETKIRVIALRHVGGGFGNKGAGHVEPIVASLAKETRRPVKISLTREEVFSATSVRHPSVIYVKDGVKKDGTIVGRQVKVIYNGGAYSLAGNVVNKNCIHALTSVYKLPSLKADIYRVYTNQVQGGAFRGFGAPQAHFAIESQMDIVAKKLGIDPIEFRKKNLIGEGEKSAIGERFTGITLKECIDQVVEAVKKNPLPKTEGKWKYGNGYAISKEQCDVSFPSVAYAKLIEDGSVEIWTSATDPGEGIHTVLSQIAAEEMGIQVDNVRMVLSDTDLTPVGTGASGSRQTSQMGMAVKLACEDLKRNIARVASQRFGVEERNIFFRSGKILIEDRDVEYSSIFFPGPMGGAYVPGQGSLIGHGFYLPKTGDLDPETGQCSTEKAAVYYTPVAQAARVAINTETGTIKVVEYIGAVDVGKSINPLNVIGQNEGAISMGLNGAMNEEMVLANGRIINPDLKDYKLQSIMEYFPINSIILENPNPDGPYGARGCGEAPISPVGAALANAVYDAIGVRFTDLPITSEKILLALKAMKN
ncbi:MAG TPA: xanthine dehydrogenase family protein molybdopterin-binding subunit [Nitrososphaerales archaeon]|nr:xanthine dehydrogenase family protein molybdopterin-binding subunit [Nitrososphaerales archaeon]